MISIIDTHPITEELMEHPITYHKKCFAEIQKKTKTPKWKIGETYRIESSYQDYDRTIFDGDWKSLYESYDSYDQCAWCDFCCDRIKKYTEDCDCDLCGDDRNTALGYR